MRFLFLNQYFPPDPAPTGILLKELAEHWRESGGHSVEFISAGESYRAGQAKGGRMRREARALWTMLWRGLRAPRADVVLSASSPPCLLIVATLVQLWHRARGVHWLMDMYPELAVTLGEIPGGWISRCLSHVMGWCYRRQSLVVALDEDMAARLQRYGVRAEIIGPWVFAPMLPKLAELRASAPLPEVPWTWIYSGNLGRAHEWETLLQAQLEIEQRDGEIELLFQGGGPARAAAQARAEALGLRRCRWRGYVEEDAVASSLLACQVCAVTQLPEAQGLLWPSKLGLLLTLPRWIVWVGVPDGAITRELSQLPHACVFAPGQGKALADWLLELKRRAPVTIEPPVEAAASRSAALDRWSAALQGVLTH